MLHRYTEFHKLYDHLKKSVPNFSIKLPGKRFFGNNFDPLFVKNRKDGIGEFITKIAEDDKLMDL